MSKEANTAGLAGVVAGNTALSTVGKAGKGLTYRGYRIEDLAENATFEEVAWLLLRGELPTAPELQAYQSQLKSQRGLPDAMKAILEQLPADSHPMDVLRTGCSALGSLEPDVIVSQALCDVCAVSGAEVDARLDDGAHRVDQDALDGAVHRRHNGGPPDAVL